MSINVTLIEGDGIGPEIMSAACMLLSQSGADINFEPAYAGVGALSRFGDVLPEATLESIRKNKIALKGPLTTPVGTGFRSVNVALRREFDLYANVRPAKSLRGVLTPFSDVDIITVRENTEGLYTGIEYEINPDVTQAIRTVTRAGSERILRYAFELAKREGRKKVSVLHKANILKTTDGLFTRIADEIAAEYPQISCEKVIIDAACMKLVTNPEKFDVIVTTNLFGDIVSDLASGLIGGLGLTCGSNIGEGAAIFEAVHGSAPDIAGQGVANPTAVIMASVEMLKYLGMKHEAEKINSAVLLTLAEGAFLTKDLGGSAGTMEFAEAVAKKM